MWFWHAQSASVCPLCWRHNRRTEALSATLSENHHVTWRLPRVGQMCRKDDFIPARQKQLDYMVIRCQYVPSGRIITGDTIRSESDWKLLTVEPIKPVFPDSSGYVRIVSDSPVILMRVLSFRGCGIYKCFDKTDIFSFVLLRYWKLIHKKKNMNYSTAYHQFINIFILSHILMLQGSRCCSIWKSIQGFDHYF